MAPNCVLAVLQGNEPSWRAWAGGCNEVILSILNDTEKNYGH